MSSLKKWALALAIAIVLNLFVNYGISVFYKAPLYDDFCRDSARPYHYKIYPAEPQLQQQQTDCAVIEVSEELQNSCGEQKGYVAFKYNSTGCPTEAYCELCGKMFNDINNRRNSNVFVILVVFGVAAIIAGMVLKAEAVANGFLIGGILSLIVAAIRNWGQLQDAIKLIILGAGLALLIWIGYRKGSTLIPQQQQKKKEIRSRDKK
ncbi:MAG: sodium/calcium exchanger protein [Nanoarchaeota archaeon]